MRRRAPQLFAVAAAVLVLQVHSAAQVVMRPTPAPIVTAQNEDWYLAGEAITHAGIIYHPTGPNVYFDSHQMVRSGHYRGIPLYSLTTIEPYSRVYVPIGGGLMRPYERLRTGDLAGTTGSTLPALPVVGPYDTRPEDELLGGIVRAPAPPVAAEPAFGTAYQTPVGGQAAPGEPVATTGREIAPYPLGPLVSARKPEGLDGMFIEFRDRRWFSSGSAVELDSTRFTRIGEYHGFPVYRRTSDSETVYVTVSRGASDLVAPYSIRR